MSSSSPRARKAKIDSAAAAKALNSAGGAGAAAAGGGAKSSSSSSREQQRRSTASNSNTSSIADRLPTTRVSVASPDRASGAAAALAAGGSSSSKKTGSTASRVSTSRASIITPSSSSSEPGAKGAGAAGAPPADAKHTLPAPAADGGADASDAASIRSTHTLKTLHGSPTASAVKLPGSSTASSHPDAGSNGPALLLLPSASDDADEETGAIDVHAWDSAPSAGIGNGRADLENGGAPSDPVELSRWRRQVLLRTGVRLFILFVVCTALLVGTLWIALPTIDEKDRPFLKIPKSLADLKALNTVLQHYKNEHYARVALCWIVVYMFLQAFSIPGSMYMSILAGALWGVPVALPLVCASVATGATICYLISQTMGEALVAVPKWKARVDSWKERLAEYNDNLLSYMILIRMMPLPPHNVVNLLAPHLGITIPMFWLSTALGIFAVSFIHTTIGEKLDDMASSDDFHLLSVRNALLFLGVCGAVLVPVLIRKRAPVAPLEEQEQGATGAVRLPDDDAEGSAAGSARNSVAAIGRSILGIGARGLGSGRGRNVHEEEEEVDDDDDDFAADYDDDADELPPVSDPDTLAAARSDSLSRAASRKAASRSRPSAARVLRPPGPPGPEDIDDEDPTKAWRARSSAAAVGDDSDASDADARSEDSHLSAPFSDDRREDRGPGRERGQRRRRPGTGGPSSSLRRTGGGARPGTWAGAGAEALGRANEAVGDVAGRVRSWFGGRSNGVALR
ncbi:hypothetical protein OC835_003059 [Tilletia horrida]|nr:hypothetical protein OC835_003059 [Tilletia horrida]